MLSAKENDDSPLFVKFEMKASSAIFKNVLLFGNVSKEKWLLSFGNTIGIRRGWEGERVNDESGQS